MSKGGTTSGSTEIPAWLENAAIENINKARDVSQIGYVPHYGPDVAAFSPMQQQSMQSTGNAASAFGLAPQGFDAMAGMPQAQTFAGGLQGYSSAPLYEQSLDKLFANAPAQYNAMNNMFIDPFTGARPQGNYAASPTQVSQMSSGNGGGYVSPTPTPDFTPALDGGTGYWSGGERTATQTNDMTDPEFEAYVLAHGLPQADQYTTGDAIGGLIGNMADSTLIGRLYEGVTGNPLGGGSFNAPISGLDSSDVSGGRFNGMVGYEDYNPNIDGGLLGNTTPLPDNNIVSGSNYYGNGDQYAQSLAAVQAAQSQRIAQERANADAARSAASLQAEVEAQNYAAEQAAAAQRMAVEKANQLAHNQAMAAARSTVNSGGGGNPNKGNNSSGGSTYSGGGKAASSGYGGISGGGGR